VVLHWVLVALALRLARPELATSTMAHPERVLVLVAVAQAITAAREAQAVMVAVVVVLLAIALPCLVEPVDKVFWLFV
jgi:hypothetical protein